LNSIISWVGGKKALRDLIYLRMPTHYDRYIEVFGGGGWVLFGKPPDKCMEVYNDFNSNLANLFYCVKERPMALLRELSFLPLNSRDEFVTLRKFLTMEEFKSEHLAEELEIATHFLKEPEAAEICDILKERAVVGDVKRAAAFYKIIRYSYGSGCTSYGCQPFDIRKTFTILWEANRRLKDTVIENKDFEALIRQYDRPNAFFYCDPPYYETEGHYEVVFRKEDHVRLRDTLAGIEGKFMVSYNDCEYIRELYQDFRIEAVTRINNLAQRYDNGSEFPEVLIANYDMEERRNSLPTQMNLFELCGEQESVVWKCSKRKEDEDVSVSGDQGKSE
jgi:DNA adenine methylase